MLRIRPLPDRHFCFGVKPQPVAAIGDQLRGRGQRGGGQAQHRRSLFIERSRFETGRQHDSIYSPTSPTIGTGQLGQIVIEGFGEMQLHIAVALGAGAFFSSGGKA